jgi:hypothetical protein
LCEGVEGGHGLLLRFRHPDVRELFFALEHIGQSLGFLQMREPTHHSATR